MSNPIQSIPSAVGEFQANFGAPPAGQDATAACEKWERLCAQLIAQREELRAKLAKAEADSKLLEKSLVRRVCGDLKLDLTMEEVFAQVDRETTIDQFIAELKQEVGPTA